MLNKEQNQQAASNATAIQAAGDIHLTLGVTAAEARAIALDVAKSTFYELSGTARDTASSRVEEITDKVIEKIQREAPAHLGKANDPGFQYALLTVQKQFARNGDKELGDLLVDLLVDQSRQDQRSLMEIVLTESLETAPKLTEAQIAILALIFLFKHTRNNTLASHELLASYFDMHVLPFADKLTRAESSYQHLEFAACGSVQLAEVQLEEILVSQYQGLFTTGFDISLVSNGLSNGLDHFFIECLNDPNKLQVNALCRNTLQTSFDDFKVSAADREKISELFAIGKMNYQQVREKCISIRPYMESVFDCWNESSMKNFFLTSVGIAIGHAKIRRAAPNFGNLSIWIK